MTQEEKKALDEKRREIRFQIAENEAHRAFVSRIAEDRKQRRETGLLPPLPNKPEDSAILR